MFDQLEASHVRQSQIEHRAVERFLADRGECLFTCPDRDRLDVVIADELDDAVALDFIILDYEQLPRGLLDEGLEAAEGRVERLFSGGLAEIAEGAHLKPSVIVLLDGD